MFSKAIIPAGHNKQSVAAGGSSTDTPVSPTTSAGGKEKDNKDQAQKSKAAKSLNPSAFNAEKVEKGVKSKDSPKQASKEQVAIDVAEKPEESKVKEEILKYLNH